VKYILILLHQAGVFNYLCMMHGTTKLKNHANHFITDIIMQQRYGNTAVRSEVITTVLLCIQVIWKDTLLTGRYGSNWSFDRSQSVHGARKYLPHNTLLTPQETSSFMMNLVLKWWHTLKFCLPLLPWYDTPTLLRSEILTAVLLKIQVFCDVTFNHWASSSWEAKGSQLGEYLAVLLGPNDTEDVTNTSLENKASNSKSL